VRNPHANKSTDTWKGKWSFNDQNPIYKWTVDLRKQLKCVLNPGDGIFFMCWEDFIKYFSKVNICLLNKSYKNSWMDLKCKNGDFMSVGIKIKQ
jgi:hypothetical protein